MSQSHNHNYHHIQSETRRLSSIQGFLDAFLAAGIRQQNENRDRSRSRDWIPTKVSVVQLDFDSLNENKTNGQEMQNILSMS